MLIKKLGEKGFILWENKSQWCPRYLYRYRN